jgi:hypothetical protein
MTKQQGLASALLAAQQALPSVGKDAKNSFHHYAYTSAEGMISACREALHGAGLTLRRAGWKFDGTPEGGLVHSQFILSHGASGEAVTDEVTWIAVPEKGRPVDKAVAGALTSSLGYYLRDLLLVPREDESEMDRRDDRAYEPRKAATPAPRPAPAPAARQTQQEAPRAVPAPKAAPTPPKPAEPATEVPSGPMREVIGSRPPAAAAWKAEPLRILKAVKSDKPTKNGSTRWAILFQTSGDDTWASTFDGDVADAASEARDAAVMVEALIADGQYGWTLYGLRWPEVASAPAPQAVEVAEEHIPF